MELHRIRVCADRLQGHTHTHTQKHITHTEPLNTAGPRNNNSRQSPLCFFEEIRRLMCARNAFEKVFLHTNASAAVDRSRSAFNTAERRCAFYVEAVFFFFFGV